METTSPSQPLNRVLVIRIGHLGDSVLASTVIEPIRSAYGEHVLIDFVSGPGVSAAILEMDERIHRVFPVSRRRLPWRLSPEKRALRQHARQHPYDVVINLECGDECNDFTRFVTCRSFHGRPFLSREHEFHRHCVETEKSIYRDLLGIEATAAAQPSIQPGAQAKPFSEGRRVLINPGFAGITQSGYRSHRGWPAEHWAELIDLVVKREKMDVSINGTAAELPFLAPLLSLRGTRSLVGSSIRELVDEICAAACVISVDTGTMHLGAALGTPVIALFGPTIPALTGPFSHSVPCRTLTSGIDCQPCDRTPLQKRCAFDRCMSELAPRAVFAAMQELLEDSGHTGDSLA